MSVVSRFWLVGKSQGLRVGSEHRAAFARLATACHSLPLGAQLFNKRLPSHSNTQVLKLRFKFWDVLTRCVEMDEQPHSCPCQYALRSPMRCWDSPSRGTPHWQGLEGTIFQHSWVSLSLNYQLHTGRIYGTERCMSSEL